MRLQRKVGLTVLLFTTVAFAATTAGADQKTIKGPRDPQSIMADVRNGKARKVDTPQSRFRHTTGVWTGCQFLYLTTKVTDWVTEAGEQMSVSEDPDPKPPKDRSECPVDRNPTEAEMVAMHAEVEARNAAARPPDAGLRPIPPEVVAARNTVGK